MESVLDAILSPLSITLDPGRRLFWLFLLSSLVLASITVAVQQRRFDLREQLRSLGNRRYWFNRSTATDGGLLFLNSLIRGSLLIPLLGSHLAGTILVGSWLQSQFGDAPSLNLAPALIAITYTVVFFITEDFSRFALHTVMHKFPVLWHFHRTHHSATTLTPLTVHRVHPVEMALYYLRGLVVFSVISGSFVYLFRGQVSGVAILGVDCLGFLFNALGANLRHSHIFLSFGRLERWFISPAQHQIHHSSAVEHQDRNFGTCLAIWDRLLNSWTPAGQRRDFSFGLTEQARSEATKNPALGPGFQETYLQAKRS